MKYSNLFCSVLITAALLATGSALAASNDGRGRRVWVHNETDTIVAQFFASTTNQESWEEDILGSDVLLPGESVRINLDDGSGLCRFDLMAVFITDYTHIKHSVNVCAVSNVRIRANGIRVY